MTGRDSKICRLVAMSYRQISREKRQIDENKAKLIYQGSGLTTGSQKNGYGNYSKNSGFRSQKASALCGH